MQVKTEKFKFLELTVEGFFKNSYKQEDSKIKIDKVE